MTQTLPEPNLDQRGRSSLDFLAHLFHGSAPIRQATKDALRAQFSDGEQLPDDLSERDAAVTQFAGKLPTFRATQTIGEWHAAQHGRVAIQSFEAQRDTLEPKLKALDSGSTKLHVDTKFQAPAYWQGVDYHRTAGGWDGHEFMGYIHGEIVHKLMVNAVFPGNILTQRRNVAAMAKRDHYDKILEMGASTGHYTQALAETYPDAQIIGIDLSIRTLEQARRAGNVGGYAWQLYQRAAENTGFDDNSMDLVTSYILLHEMPADAIRAAFTEALRVLKPGGELLMSDVTRMSDLSPMDAWQADHNARFGGEPYWVESASLDLAALLREVGFENVNAEGFGPNNYPYVVSGTKPV